MKEDVLKFRKLCEILIIEKEYSFNKISKESGITWPTMTKLLKAPIDDMHIMPSVLGQVQDFIKKHANDIKYAGIESEPIELSNEPLIHLKPGVKEARKKELKEKRKEHSEKIEKLIYPSDEERKRALINRERLPENKEDIESLLQDSREKNAKEMAKHPFFSGKAKETVRIDELPPDEFRGVFCRVWLEALSRGVLVQILHDSGYSGELTKKIVI